MTSVMRASGDASAAVQPGSGLAFPAKNAGQIAARPDHSLDANGLIDDTKEDCIMTDHTHARVFSYVGAELVQMRVMADGQYLGADFLEKGDCAGWTALGNEGGNGLQIGLDEFGELKPHRRRSLQGPDTSSRDG